MNQPTSQPLYSIGTWDPELQAFTPQDGVPAFNLTRKQLVESMRLLRNEGYTCHRFRERERIRRRQKNWREQLNAMGHRERTAMLEVLNQPPVR